MLFFQHFTGTRGVDMSGFKGAIFESPLRNSHYLTSVTLKFILGNI